jgi:hypothetical protein
VLSKEKDPFWIEAPPSRIELERTSPSAQGARQPKVIGCGGHYPRPASDDAQASGTGWQGED